MASLRIEYELPEEEWERVAIIHNRCGYPTIDCFFGHVQLHVDEHPILGEPYHMSVADLACGLAELFSCNISVMRRDKPFHYREEGGELELTFHLHADSVSISTNKGHAAPVTVSIIDFAEGLEVFLRKFTHELSNRVPDFSSWRDLSILERYASADSTRRSE